jgi:hypothetical protein
VTQAAGDLGLIMGLTRIEVHHHVDMPDGMEPESRWQLTVFRTNDGIAVSAYLRTVEEEGLGQAQAGASYRREAWRAGETSPKVERKITEWILEYLNEIMYDLIRRALQSQAAEMDFQFAFPIRAPDPVLRFV